MVPATRVILANTSGLLREVLHRALEKTNGLEIAQEIPEPALVSLALQRFDPAWVILNPPDNKRAHQRLDAWMEDFPAARFILLSPHQKGIKIRGQAFEEREYSDLSLKELIFILEEDLRHI